MKAWLPGIYQTAFAAIIWLGMSVPQARAQDFEFASLRGTPISTVGWNLQGAAYVGQTDTRPANGEVILTDPQINQSGAIFFNTPINLSRCNRWVAEFEFRIHDGTVADGLAFCYLNVPPSGFVTGGGIGIPATANGLKVVIDTWRNCGTDAIPKLQIRWGAGYEECNGQPTRNNNDGRLSFLRASEYQTCRIEYNQGFIRVLIDGTEYLSGFQTFDFEGYFGFTASTGAFTDRHSIRNVRIFTEMPPSEAGEGLSLCPGATGQLGITPNPAYRYQWSPAAGLSDVNVANPVLTASDPGETIRRQWYYVSTFFSDRPGCGSRDSVEVTLLPRPRASFTHDTVCLPGGRISFTNTSRWNGAPAAGLNWSWQFGDPLATPANPNTSTALNPSHIYQGAGPFSVRLQATTPEGCTGDTVISIRPVVGPPVFQTSIAGDSCSGFRLQFRAVENPASGMPLTAVWRFGDGSPPVSGIQAEHVYAAEGTYPLSVEVSNPYCPAVSEGRSITIRRSATVQLSPAGPFCLNDPPVLLSPAVVTNGVTGMGRYEGPGVSGNLFSPVLAGAGPARIDHVFTADNGCVTRTPLPLQVWPLPQVSAGPDRVSLEERPVTLQGSAGPGAVILGWSPPAYLSDPMSLTPTANPPDDTRYILQARSAEGCIAADTAWVRVLPALRIPNAFSPNGDGINDTWQIAFLNQYPGCTVRVFDRYGRLVYNSTGYEVPWDGTRQGQPLPVGTYYYIIDPRNGAQIRQGSVTILR